MSTSDGQVEQGHEAPVGAAEEVAEEVEGRAEEDVRGHRLFSAAAVAAEAEARGEDPLSTVLGQAIGAASACWDNLVGAGVFESERARDILTEVHDYVRAYAAGVAQARAEAATQLFTAPVLRDGDRLVALVEQPQGEQAMANLQDGLGALEHVLRGEGDGMRVIAVSLEGLRQLMVVKEGAEAPMEVRITGAETEAIRSAVQEGVTAAAEADRRAAADARRGRRKGR